MTYTYTELTPDQQLAAINARIRDLEAQHLQLELRVEAPALGEGQNDQDAASLAALEESLQKLHTDADALTKAQAAPEAPAAKS